MALTDLEREFLQRLSTESWDSPPRFDHSLVVSLVEADYVRTEKLPTGSVHYEITEAGRAAIADPSPAALTNGVYSQSSSTATVYRVDFYDVQSDALTRSRRWFTREGAALVNGIVIEETAIEVDAAALEAGKLWTPRPKAKGK